jgi:hypothetical protein
MYKTTFRTLCGLFKYYVLPFELCNARASFQAMMNRVLVSYLGKLCVVYLHDVMVYNRTAD